MNESEKSRNDSRFTASSGNVFADVDLSDPELALAKVRLAEAIEETIARRGLTQKEAGTILAADQPTISRIVNGSLDGFSQERLMRYLTSLGDNVEIAVHHPEHYGSRGKITVTVDSE